MAKKGIRIRAVAPGSAAHAVGLTAGDEILSVNGRPVRDELALRFYLAEGAAVLEVRRADGSEERFDFELDDAAGLGIEVEDFRTLPCNNSCLFCFVDQLPPGVRPSLRVKDDDYRLSFLHGNYITLTNLNDRDLDRIIEHALSPLYVSVHATEPGLRTRIMGRRKADDLAGKLRRLIDGGIRMYAQVVLMPHINDGEHLTRTVSDLFSLYPGMDSVAVVPLGLSDFARRPGILKQVTPGFCRKVIAQAAPWQERYRREAGRGFVYLGDEFFIQGGHTVPDAGYYDDFALIEDGVGMVRRFLDNFASGLARRRTPRPGLRGTLATGTLFFPFLSECISRVNRKLGSQLRVAAVENRFLGSGITVAGLLAGRDFVDALAGSDLGDFVMIPQDAIASGEGIFLDDLTPADLAGILKVPVIPGGATVAECFRRLCRHPDTKP